MHDEKIILLLDVDGVLNDFTTRVIDPVTGALEAEHLTEFMASTEGRTFPIRYDETVAARLAEWHREGVVEIRWLTTWAHDANAQLSEQLGLPADLAVADDAYKAADPFAEKFGWDWRHSSGWWKAHVARELYESDQAARVVWLDDDLAVYAGTETLEWLADSEDRRIIAIAPYPSLSHAELDAIEEWISL